MRWGVGRRVQRRRHSALKRRPTGGRPRPRKTGGAEAERRPVAGSGLGQSKEEPRERVRAQSDRAQARRGRRRGGERRRKRDRVRTPQHHHREQRRAWALRRSGAFADGGGNSAMRAEFKAGRRSGAAGEGEQRQCKGEGVGGGGREKEMGETTGFLSFSPSLLLSFSPSLFCVSLRRTLLTRPRFVSQPWQQTSASDAMAAAAQLASGRGAREKEGACACV